MSTIDELLEHNRRHADEVDREPTDAKPRRRLTIVTCMDCRIDLNAALGLGRGDAHVLRNAGGIVSDDIVRSLAISQRKLGTEAVMVIHHTDCGMEKITDEEFAAELEAAAGAPPQFPIGAFRDAAEDVSESLRRLRESRYLARRDDVRGFVYDVATNELREVF